MPESKPDRAKTEERLAEATSDETLDELEGKKAIPDSASDTSSGDAPVPAPDGRPKVRGEEDRDSGPRVRRSDADK